MRARIARRLVKAASGWIDMSYKAHEMGWTEMEKWANRVARFESHVFIPLACRIDKEAAVDQMIVECWWG